MNFVSFLSGTGTDNLTRKVLFMLIRPWTENCALAEEISLRIPNSALSDKPVDGY
jgi:hypothetical protein